MRAHLVRAFRVLHPDPALADFLRTHGATARSIGDEQALTRVQTRSPIELPERQTRAIRQVDGFDWHLARCKVPAAWALVGGPEQIAWSVRIGQIDTGYTAHPALGFGLGDPWLQVEDSRTFVPEPDTGLLALPNIESGDGIDTLNGFSAGHGTRIASTICGCDRSATGGAFFGVAPKAPLVMVRICDGVIVSDRQREMAQALRYLVTEAKVNVINVGLGFLPPGATVGELKDALSEAYDAGVIIVCAAGNQVDSVVVPARLNRTIALAGVTAADVPWSGSSFGPPVEISAPAKDLRRADVKRGSAKPKFNYGNGGDGTSYATAMTAGTAALWLQHRAADNAATYDEPWQRVAAFRKIARATARVPAMAINGNLLWQPGSFGTGILDVEAIVRANLPATATLIPPEPQL